MAELLECRLCGFKTVRCGMTNHLKSKHPISFDSYQGDIVALTKSLGKVKNWSQNRNQEPKLRRL